MTARGTISQQVGITPTEQPTPTSAPSTSGNLSLQEYREKVEQANRQLEEQKRLAKSKVVEYGRIKSVNPRDRSKARRYYSQSAEQIGKSQSVMQKEIQIATGAEKTLKDIQDWRIKDISNIPEEQFKFIDKESVSSYIQQRLDYEAAVQQQADYEYGYRIGIEGKFDPTINNNTWAKMGYQVAKGSLDAYEARKEFKDISGMSVSTFQNLSQEQLAKIDPERLKKLEKAGYIKLEYPTQQTSSNEYINNQNKKVSSVLNEQNQVLTGFGFSSMTGKSIFTDIAKQEPVTKQGFSVYSEVQRYQNLGYSIEDSKTLAKASMEKGGMSFTSSAADKIIETQKVKNKETMDLLYGSKKSEFLEGFGSDWSTSKSAMADKGNYDNSWKSRSIASLGFSTMGNELGNQGISSSNKVQVSKESGKTYEDSFSGKLSKAWNWLEENSPTLYINKPTSLKSIFIPGYTPLSFVPQNYNIYGEVISIAETAVSAKKIATDTTSKYDVNLANEEAFVAYQKSVKNLDINPYTNEWLGTEEDLKAYNKKVSIYEDLEADYKKKGTWGQIKSDFIDWGAGAYEYVPRTLGGVAFVGAEIYGGVKLGGMALKGVNLGYSSLPQMAKSGIKLTGLGLDLIGIYQGIKTGRSQENPWTTRVTGFGVAGISAFSAGLTVAPKVTDVWRTRGLTKVDDVIAPEYLKGQKYPQIKKGQTAGELLDEFKVQGYGYTASPNPFAETTTALRGTSELPGIYQAPKVSPTFLKVSGEQDKLFGLSLPTFRPSVMRITPDDFKLVPGIKASQSNIAKSSLAKRFYETAQKGTSFVPYMKTEKEAVIPFGTQLRQTGKSGYFVFEGRRVPIFDFQTVKEALGTQKTLKKTSNVVGSIEDFSSYYNRRFGSSSAVNPFSAISLAKYSNTSTSKTSKGSLSKSNIFSASFNYNPFTGSTGKSRPSKSRPRPSSRGSSYSDIDFGYNPYSFGGSSGKPQSKPKPMWNFKTQGQIKQKKVKGKAYNREYDYAASLSAVLLGVTSKKMPKQKIFSGFEARPMIIPNRKSARRPKRTTWKMPNPFKVNRRKKR